MTFITISRAVIEQALEALEYERNANNPLDWHHDKTINALRSALEQPAQKRPQNCGTGYCSCIECVMEQPQQEPVAWMCTETKVLYDHDTSDVDKYHGFKPTVPLYTSPPASKPWVGLTEEEIAEGQRQSWVDKQAFESAAWWAEAKLREKNT